MRKQSFQIILDSGDIKTIQCRNMVEAAGEYPDAIEIKSIDVISLKKRVASLNKDLASVSYLASNEINSFFRRALEDSGFPVPMEISEIGSSSNGGMNIDIGGAFMHVSWHRMEVSGKFEIVAYCN